MEIKKNKDGNTTTVTVVGRVDTTTAPELEAALVINDSEVLVLDLSGVPYMSSAGLRSLLTAQKHMMSLAGSMKIIGVQPMVKGILDITGFSNILTIE